MTNIIENLKKGKDLSFEESKILFSELMEGKHNENSIIEILEAFLKKVKQKMSCWRNLHLREKAS